MKAGKGARLGWVGGNQPRRITDGWLGQLLVSRMLHDIGNLAVRVADEEPPDAPRLGG